ncbi:MAG: hypothetical protein KDC87_09075, partial [Planctomycetes bacterium]|nr:hypothetical protein [Planctomycetota bacterium]
LDGSIPTGFQRTALIGIGGTIPFHDSELGDDQVLRIRQLTLEEDSCREVSDIGHRITFRTDRLGMPLVETVTEPDLRTPHDVAAGGRLIAAVARASGHARRGSGSGRQDVNVSIAGSRRVELKGVGRHAVLPRLVHNEAFRHLNLLRIRAALRERGITADLLDGCLHADLGGLLAGCGFAPIERAARDGSVLRAVRLPGFGTLLGHRTQPGRTFAHEFAERVRVIACLTTRPFLLAEDDDGGALAAARWREVRMAVRADAEDAVLLVWGPREDIDTASHEIVLRAKAALVGVPSETRQAHPDGTTGFERILPGPQRMYPDTDTPPLPIPDAWVAEVESRTVELPWQRRARYIAKGLPAPAARRMAHSTWAELYDELAIEDPPTARRIAFALEARLPHFWRSSGVRTLPAAERLRPLVRALVEGRMHPSGTNWVLDRLLREPDTAASDIVDAHRLDDRPADPLPASPTTDANARLRWAMGRTLRGRTRGSFDPQQIRTDLSHSLGEVRE